MATLTQITVRGYHEDRFGHVNNARYLEFLEQARWEHLEEQGLSIDHLEAHGVFPVVVRMAISYRRPASAGNALEITTKLSSTSSRRVVLEQEARFAESEEVCIRATVTAVFLATETGRPVALSHDLFKDWTDLQRIQYGVRS